MSSTNTVSLLTLLKKTPYLLKGMPSRLQGLYIASRKELQGHIGLGACLEQAAERNPHGDAIVFEDRRLSYRAFNEWVNRIANYLRESGTQKGDVVALLLENRPELLACVAALAKLGAVSALLNTSQRGEVLAHSVALVKPKRIIVGQELVSVLEPLQEVLPVKKAARLYLADADTLQDPGESPEDWLNLAEACMSMSCGNPEPDLPLHSAEPCCYFYTSGTTGLPKAAVLTHGRFMKAYAGVGLASLQLTSSDRVYVTLPFYHATAMVVAWGSVLAGSATLVMARNFSASRFWEDVRRYGVTAFCYVGELCRYLLALPESARDKDHKVRLMFGNGLRPGIWEAFKQRFGVDRVVEFYGSSEGNIGFLNLFNLDSTVGFTTVSYAIVEYDLEREEAVRYQDGFMRRVKRGEAGLLLGEITEQTPFDGYTEADKTEASILRNVFRSGDAWFNTGDLMRDQGFRHVQFVDRLGDTFRWKGENVSTTEVENTLAGLPEVIDAVVYGVEVPGASGRAGMACLRLAEGASFDGRGICRMLKDQLPSYAVPLFIRIAPNLAQTGTFKYRKVDLKKEGFDPDLVDQPLWVMQPDRAGYIPMNEAIYRKITAGTYRL